MYKWLLLILFTISCSNIRNNDPSKDGKLPLFILEDCDFTGELKSSTAKHNCFYIPDNTYYKNPVLKYHFNDGSRILIKDSKGSILSDKKAKLYSFSIINNSTCLDIDSFFGVHNYWILDIENNFISINSYINLPFDTDWKWSSRPFTQRNIISTNKTPQITDEILLLMLSTHTYSKSCIILKNELISIKSYNFFETSNKRYNANTIHDLVEKVYLPRLLVCSMSGDTDCQNILINFRTYFDHAHFEEGAYAELITDYQYNYSIYKSLLKKKRGHSSPN